MAGTALALDRARAQGPEDPPTTATTSTTVAEAVLDTRPSTGRHLYLRDCAVCHGADGRGTIRGPDLEGVGTASVDFQLVTGQMPLTGPGSGLYRPSPPEYTDAEIEAIVDQLRPVVAGGPPVPDLDLGAADVARGGTLYRAHCAGCHGTAGVGGALVFAEDSAPALGDVEPTVTAEALLVGPGTMPIMSPGALDERGVRDVTAYVDEILTDPPDPGGHHLWHLGPVPEGAVAWIVGMGALLIVSRWIGSTMRNEQDEEAA